MNDQPGMDRRALDPTIRAEVHHVDGMFGVKTGDGAFILHNDADNAHRQAMVHNAINGHETMPTDRRKS